MEKRHNYKIKKEWIIISNGIVPALYDAVNAYTNESDGVIVFTPVYYPFYQAIKTNNRQIVKCPLINKNTNYTIDFEKFVLLAQNPKNKMVILCNPHNPGGVVWTEAELRAIADICYDEKVLVFSDEIHADLTLPPHTHRPFATVSEKARMNSVTFMSPSKAFNMPGLSASHALIFNEDLRKRFRIYMDAGELDMGHVFAFLSVEAAYSHGTEWLDQCLAYIQGNIDFVDDFLKNHAPKIKAIRPGASYLVWLDCRELKLSQKDLNEFFVDKAHLALNDGEMFGKEGIGFMRLNVASPRCIIEKAMKQLADAYQLYIK